MIGFPFDLIARPSSSGPRLSHSTTIQKCNDLKIVLHAL